MTPEQRLSHLAPNLPPPFIATGMFKTTVIMGSVVYVAGHGPLLRQGEFIIGKVGVDLDVEQARAAARQTGLSILSTLRNALGSLDRVNRVLKTLGMVNCIETFTEHPAVIDGCSELMAEVFGADKGVGVRAAVGMSSLPFGMPVEVETILELNSQNYSHNLRGLSSDPSADGNGSEGIK